MKLFYLFASVLLLNTVHAQQIFQGSIVYNLHTPKEKEDAELTIQYGPNKIKVKFKEKEDYDETYLLMNLDSGIFYTINTETKTFQVKKLVEITTQEVALNSKSIAGYATNPVNVTGSGVGGLFGFSGTTILYTAADLYFPVPKKYSSAPQLIMVQDNHIVLGADINMLMPGMAEEMPDSLKMQMKVTAEAKKVTPQQWDAAEFTIPADFTQVSENYFPMSDDTTDVIADTTMMMVDTLAVPPPVKKKTTPKPSTPKKITPTKTEATKPKKTQTKS